MKQGDVISTDEAIGKLIRDVTDAEAGLRGLLKVAVKQQEFDALVSWVFNLGAEKVKDSTLIRLLNEGKNTDAADQLLRWTKANGKELRGLVRRRSAERDLFLGKV